ncbi:hypothetical protein KY363_03860 [Candidatus Woesearchaeota archaeon]|nr:hypothetical protein [Candidatus Woesearchaeota archaeon]
MEQAEQIAQRKQVIVAVFTPYLTQSLADLETPGFSVRLDKPRDHISRGPAECILGIHGSTEPAEETVAELKGSGLIIARYSIFYGGPSKYTGNYPEDTGYALDLPKNVSTVKAFLTDDEVLDALVLREEARIRQAIDGLNKTLQQPVLITPFLEEALRVRP